MTRSSIASWDARVTSVTRMMKVSGTETSQMNILLTTKEDALFECGHTAFWQWETHLISRAEDIESDEVQFIGLGKLRGPSYTD